MTWRACFKLQNEFLYGIKCQLLVDKNGKMYFKNEIPVEIEHQEHKTIEIPAGIWEIEKVVEYDHFLEEAREVID